MPAPPAETGLERLLRDAAAIRTGPRVDFRPMAEGCAFLADCVRNAQQLRGEKWEAFVRLAGRSFPGALDGRGLVHYFGEQHPGYNPPKTEEMLALALRHPEPPTCRRIGVRLDSRGRFCRPCAHRGLIDTPFELGLPAGAPPRPGADTATADRAAAVGADREPAAPIAGEPIELRIAPARPGADRETLKAGADYEHAVLHDLVFGLAELLDHLGHPATARQIVRQLADTASVSSYPRLRSALAELFPHLDGELPSTLQLAGRLRAYRGQIVRGACVDRIPNHHRAARWTVRKLRTKEDHDVGSRPKRRR
ncbi:MAG: hypothetical protein GY725_20740 [bacterium]|nr:hypothetical protein [bacterium]